MSNELTVIKKMDLKELGNILEFEAPTPPELVTVNSEFGLTEANKAIAEIKAGKFAWKKRVEPFKATLFAFHKKITGKENAIIGLFDGATKAQQANVSTYKKKKHEEQQELQRQADARATAEAARLQAKEDARIAAAKTDLEEAAEEAEDTEDGIALIESSEKLVPDKIEVKKESVFYKKDRVKVKYEYYIPDDKLDEFIKWAYINARHLLKIDVSKEQFRMWAKIKGNADRPFIGKRESYR